jgi:predicted permease
MTDSGPPFRRYLRFLRPDLRADIDDELDFHLAMRARDLERAGHAENAAREAAERTFGNLDAIRNECLTIDERRFRRASRKEVLMTMWQDARFSIRSLMRSPGFTTVAVLCLAVGIAATASIFTVVRGSLIRPLPYRDAERLVSIYTAMPDRQARGVNISYHDYNAWRTMNRTFEDIGAWTWSTITLSTDDEAERVESALVSANLFTVLGVNPVLGRHFLPEEEQPGTRVIMLSHGLWQRRLGGDRNIVGRTIRVNAIDHTIVGVMPAGFAFPEIGVAWRPLPNDMQNNPGNRFFAGAIGRLKDGVAFSAAASDLESVMRRQRERLPDAYDGFTSDPVPLRDDLVGDLRRPLLIFLGAVSLLLLIVCANVANLLLARSASRDREIGVRVALGAGRRRIFGHVLLESFVLALVGGVIGALLTPWGVRLFSLTFPRNVPFYISLQVDGWIIAFVTILVGATAILMGLIPSFRATAIDVSSALREGGRSGGGGMRSSRARSVLVVSELAVSVVLLVGAVLLIRSYSALTGTQLGFVENRVLSARVSLPPSQYRERAKRIVYWNRAYEKLGAIPGVEVVGSADGIPFSGWNVEGSFSIEGRASSRAGDGSTIHYQNVSPDYFNAIGARIVAGRGFTNTDRDSMNMAVVINETFAKTQFAGASPLGKRLRWAGSTADNEWMTIVGVVSDFRHWRLPEPVRPAIYTPQLSVSSASQTFVLRTSLPNPRSLEPNVRAVLRDLDRDAPPYQVQTFEQVVAASLWRQRLQGNVLGIFAVMAVILASLGVYGVISHGVAQRTRELGVRIALGASRREVASLILSQGSRLASIGVTLGLIAAFALRGVVKQLLYGVQPADPLTFTVVPVALVGVALLASLLPALRATRVDPAVAMRAE